MEGIVSARPGLVTKFMLKCEQPNCFSSSDNDGFQTSPKKVQVYEINQRATLASRIMGKCFSNTKNIGNSYPNNSAQKT